MRKLFLIALLGLVGCGGNKATPSPTATATAEPAPTYSQGVIDHYGDPPPDPSEGVEAEYFQPPVPPEGGLGQTITLTGSNIGVRLRVTVTGVEQAGSRTAVQLVLENTGIAVYDGPLANAAVNYGRGKPRRVAKGVKADCAHGWDRNLRLDVGERTEGCLLFPADGDAQPTRLQLALETVPTTAGGIWNLTAG